MNYAPRKTWYDPNWDIEPLPAVKEVKPMTAREFRIMSSQLAVASGNGSMNRKDHGKEPLPPFHPIAKAALPRLRSLENAR